MNKSIWKILRWANVLLVLLTLGAYLAPFTHPQKTWVIPFLGLAYPFLLCVNAGFVIFWSVAKRRYFLLSLLCILAGWPHIKGIIGTSIAGTPEKSEANLKVMSFNLHFYNFYDHPGDPHDISPERKNEAENMLDLIIAEHPDVLCVQETGSYIEKQAFARLQSELGLSHLHEVKNSRVKILSRYPLSNSGRLDFDETANTGIYTDLSFNGEPMRLYNLHLQSLKFAQRDYETISNIDPDKNRSWKGFRRIAGKISRASVKRAEQAKIVAEHIAQSPYPVLVCGDFNDTPVSYTYHTIKGNMTDSFRAKGSGLGATYAGPIPALRIDYIFADQRFNILDHKILRKSNSDHYPIVSTLKLVP